jgi:hypothetical protein
MSSTKPESDVVDGEQSTSRSGSRLSVASRRARQAGLWLRKCSGILNLVLIVALLLSGVLRTPPPVDEHGQLDINKLAVNIAESLRNRISSTTRTPTPTIPSSGVLNVTRTS